MEQLALDIFSNNKDQIQRGLGGLRDTFKVDYYLIQVLFLDAGKIKKPWLKAWRKLGTYVAQQKGSNKLVERLVALAGSHEDGNVRQASLDALGCLPPDAQAIGDALRTFQLENLLRKALEELSENKSEVASSRQRRALMLAAHITIHSRDQEVPAFVSWCIAKLLEVVTLVPAREDLVYIALWALAALAGRCFYRTQEAGIGKALLSPSLIEHSSPDIQQPVLILLGHASAHMHLQDLAQANISTLIEDTLADSSSEDTSPVVHLQLLLAVCRLMQHPAAFAAAKRTAIPSMMQMLQSRETSAHAASALATAAEPFSSPAAELVVEQCMLQGLLPAMQQLIQPAAEDTKLLLALVHLSYDLSCSTTASSALKQLDLPYKLLELVYNYHQEPGNLATEPQAVVEGIQLLFRVVPRGASILRLAATDADITWIKAAMQRTPSMSPLLAQLVPSPYHAMWAVMLQLGLAQLPGGPFGALVLHDGPRTTAYLAESFCADLPINFYEQPKLSNVTTWPAGLKQLVIAAKQSAG